jgi:tetratricopeptide (TPR) repeat protein
LLPIAATALVIGHQHVENRHPFSQRGLRLIVPHLLFIVRHETNAQSRTMPSALPSPIELEVSSIRELSHGGRHAEALAAAETLAVRAPQNRDALYLVATNQRCLNQIKQALGTLERLEQQHPRFSLLYQERGYCYMTLRDARGAIDAFLRAANLNPALAASWTMLERLYRLTGETKAAAVAAEQLSILEQLPAEVVRAGSLFSDGELSAAEAILRAYLENNGNHVEAWRLLARIEHQSKSFKEAEQRLETALKLAPNYRAARLDYVRILLDQQKYLAAQAMLDTMVGLEPGNRDLLSLYAAACAGLGQHERAIVLYRRLLAASPGSFDLHVVLGHSLQSVGRGQEAVDCYRTAAAVKPSFGDAYWSLANLKTYRFSEDELRRMRSEEAAPSADPIDRYHLCFALGKAHEDRKEYAESWQFYERGNRLKRAESRYRPQITETNTRKQIEVSTAEFFSARAGVGAPDPDPIFIVGLPRSGSTLVEQILASHSLVDGTEELPDIPRIVREMEGPRSDLGNPRYPGVLAELGHEDFRRLGERYMDDTRSRRGTKPFFTDKMPNNFRHIGLIHLMLPNARIIDVRREPMACCFSNLKQLFASGQEFIYSIEDIARYYRSYLELMRHWDAVLPGRVLRVWYEDIVDDLTGNVRRILEYCGLESEPACLEFYKLERSVGTASAEQVRRPIFREGLSAWRNYQAWLGPLRDALGDAAIRYRESATVTTAA